METKWIKPTEVKIGVELLKAGEVIAMPTETVYGLAGDATNDVAIRKIFEAKGRPADNPLIVHVASVEQAGHFAQTIPPVAKRLMEAFWPGALTIILPSNGRASSLVTAGLDSIGLRMPDHDAALDLIRSSGLGLAAPSANRSGRPSPTSAKHVADDLSGRIAGIMDGGPTGIGVESTVIDCTTEPATILRPGGVTKEAIEAVIGPVNLDANLNDETAAPRSPGMKYTHYAPSAPLYLVDGGRDDLVQIVTARKEAGKRVGALVFDEEPTPADVTLSLGRSMETAAQRLYEALRKFDETDVEEIYVNRIEPTGVALAVYNRLYKAAGGKVVRSHEEA
ncbi:MAG: threonylcarbamoyl-AMP synthase [Exiguobacterium sp.]|uniref:L-threonylcarbamoyladenylate synthase n=1 Tax=Exiguobacterium TaxID=33986 RepID=UPI001BA97857|nr:MULTISPECIES: L-threonylcarbamoyladenylate synthase [Exiguobacterium]MDX5323373.1 threonylcarbamoyl-AMP synthase [Exiguobacterium sp.]MDX5425167.1 threonylcarbamoyl-AMP synthase [Exiguobacterium sp.]MDX6772587.1 threonylcarbamoyl-AMP synthase [Exiguobacterium sp.]QUE87048.1 threonylcarbamoyl-AMP synthase [Exiguobacterium alkaliphilum]